MTVNYHNMYWVTDALGSVLCFNWARRRRLRPGRGQTEGASWSRAREGSARDGRGAGENLSGPHFSS